MKKVILILISIIFLTVGYSQSSEYSFRLNSGLFSFSGHSSESTTFINYRLDKNDGYTNNPYGSKMGLSYGISANINRISKHNIIFGFDLGYELLRSKIDIYGVWESGGIKNEMVAANGHTSLNYSFINTFPYFGYRFTISKINIDLSGGIDFAYCLSANEKGSATSETRDYNTKRDRKTIDTELRPRIQLGFYKGNIGIYFGYSKGLRNYKSGYVGGTNVAFGNLIRFGLKYKIK